MEQDTLDNFRDQNEFWYVSKNDENSEDNTNSQRKSDKWWLPTVKGSAIINSVFICSMTTFLSPFQATLSNASPEI